MFNIKPIVFVSSTISDLSNEREAARLAIVQSDCFPAMTEHSFIAQNKNSIDVCLNEVEKSDIYLLILGGKYGFELDDGISITEKEWERAKNIGRPIIVFNLSYSVKEPKQELFAKKAGDIYKGNYWRNVNDVFALKSEIEKSLLLLFEEQGIKRKQNTEKLYSSLINISFPKNIFIGDLNIDRDVIIENSKLSNKKLSKKAANRNIIFEALRQQNLKFSSDWVCFNNKIVTFHDISVNSCPLSCLIDLGTIEKLSSSKFYNINSDYKNVFKSLLKFSLKQKLFKLGIEWDPQYNHFRFMPLDENLNKRVAKWHSKKDATRTVFEQTKTEWKGKVYYSCKHFAFKVIFMDIENCWYMNILPDWAFTLDGHKPYFKENERISYLKKNERNQHVFNHIKFVCHYLKFEDDDNLFRYKYPFLEFGSIYNFDAYPKLYDAEWLNNEKQEIKNSLNDVNQITIEF